MFGVTLGGVFIISSLIGVLTTGVETKMGELRKGRSRVIESGHTVILGWSPQVFLIISELVLANENQKNPCIVILGDKDKVEMEDEIATKVDSLRNTRVVCRTGNPIDVSDLEIVNLNESRAIVVLAPEEGDSDIHTIKTILAITNNPKRRMEPYHIVAELRDAKNMEAARLVGRTEAQLILAGDLISRITAQTCRQSGLSVIYTELLDFGGDEIYFKEEPTLVGKTFGASLFAYEDSALIGIRHHDGRVALNPAMDTVLQAGDKLVVVSADDDTIHLSAKNDFQIQEKQIRTSGSVPSVEEQTLVLGWNQRAPTIIRELDNYVSHGSKVLVVASREDGAELVATECVDLKNITISFKFGDTTARRTLDGLAVERFDHVIVLSAEHLDVQEADAQTLVTLLQLRDMSEKSGNPYYIVSEMLDVRNRELAEVTRADDFIVSDRLISLMMSQIAENKELADVFQDLFDPDGSEIYLKPAAEYIALGQPINFYTVLEAARRKGQVALGYRLRAQINDPHASYGVQINPKKSETVTFAEQDRIIVLSES
jgi:voltage-gated potassium channel Kch